MLKLLINGLAASAGGGQTYLRNVIPHLTQRSNVETTVLVNSNFFGEMGFAERVKLVEDSSSDGAGRRFVHEQTTLPQRIRESGAQVLISAGNFALWRSPVPQILLSRNSLYTSRDFLRDVRQRRDYAILADTIAKGWIARWSVRRAETTLAPSEAFAKELSEWSGRQVRVLHHGFDADFFQRDSTPLPESVQREIEESEGAVRLLFVSHYNYYRNFETLLGAMPILRSRLKDKKVKLFLTCRLSSDANPGTYRADSAAAIAARSRENGDIVELGTVRYESLHKLYKSCQIYVTPAYAESFAHPLIEAMSSGLPVVASDLPVHREICGDAAVYFSPFSSDELAERVADLIESPERMKSLAANGSRRSRDFSWSDHVDQLIGFATELLNRGAE